MYLEKKAILDKLNDWCVFCSIELPYQYKEFIATQILRSLDNERLLDFNDFVELLDHNAEIEQFKDIEFNDEIVSIECVGDVDCVDFNVSGDKLFYANDILTHNSAVNDIDSSDNSNVSDSLGTVMTADFMLFLLQNEDLKAKNEIVCKITKNRFGGVTDVWGMNIDYEHMRFSDQIVNSPTDIEPIFEPLSPKSREFAEEEVKRINTEDVRIASQSADPFKEDDLDDFLNSI